MVFRLTGDDTQIYLTKDMWQCFLDTGLSIDKAEVAMAMMKAGMFYPVGGQSQADQLKALIDSLKR